MTERQGYYHERKSTAENNAGKEGNGISAAR
jgi:hypothetical protein